MFWKKKKDDTSKDKAVVDEEMMDIPEEDLEPEKLPTCGLPSDSDGGMEPPWSDSDGDRESRNPVETIWARMPE